MPNVICQTNQDLPEEMLLGNLLFYSLSDMKISENELADIFKHNNIPNKYVRKISKIDAFRRASSSIKGKTMFIQDPNDATRNVKVKLEVDEVKSDNDRITRILGKKLIDEVNEQVKYDPVAEIVYDRSREQCDYVIFDPSSVNYQDYDKVCQEMSDLYKEWSVYHTKDTIRNTVNRIIQDVHPVNLTPTGLCKFVPKTHTPLLYSLKESLKEMEHFCQTAGNNYMEVIPVINTQEQEDLIKKASTSEIKDTLFSFTQELKEVLKQKQSLPSRTVVSYLSRFKEVEEKVNDYESLLGNYLGFLRQQLKETVKLVEDNSEQEAEVTPVYV